MTDTRCRVLKMAQGSRNSAVVGLHGTFSLVFAGNKDLLFQAVCEIGRFL